jgi:hypothetical protein
LGAKIDSALGKLVDDPSARNAAHIGEHEALDALAVRASVQRLTLLAFRPSLACVMATKRKPARKRTKRTGTTAASAAGRALSNPKATKPGKRAAASALAQTGRSARTGKKAATSAGRALRSKKTTRAGRSASGSALSQAGRRKKARK